MLKFNTKYSNIIEKNIREKFVMAYKVTKKTSKGNEQC